MVTTQIIMVIHTVVTTLVVALNLAEVALVAVVVEVNPSTATQLALTLLELLHLDRLTYVEHNMII